MTELENTVNIGPVLADQLRQVGIAELDDLIAIGAFDATRRLEAAGKHDCTHVYLALEGAIAGVRWTQLPPHQRTQLTHHWRNRSPTR